MVFQGYSEWLFGVVIQRRLFKDVGEGKISGMTAKEDSRGEERVCSGPGSEGRRPCRKSS